MKVNENPPNIRRIDTNREDAFAFKIVGHLSVSDAENFFGLLQGAYELHDKIDVLIILHDYEGFDWQAAFKQQTILGKTRALRHIRKYAIVGGSEWMGSMTTLFRPFFPMEMRHFETESEEEAWSWIGAQRAA